MVTVNEATVSDLPELLSLFLGYLDFYNAPGERDDAEAFIRARMELSQSTILLAHDGEVAVGFTQLYPSFSSVRRKPVWILNDLFVHPDHRRAGVARALMQAAAAKAEAAGIVRIELSTDETNHEAQALYEAEGYRTGLPVRYYIKRIS
jgi:ribosomal protein S18 acetylase RimI-like enzyme